MINRDQIILSSMYTASYAMFAADRYSHSCGANNVVKNYYAGPGTHSGFWGDRFMKLSNGFRAATGEIIGTCLKYNVCDCSDHR